MKEKGIIEKLGINDHMRKGIINGHIIKELQDQRNEMLEALIDDLVEYDNVIESGGYPTPTMRAKNKRNISIIEKACHPKSWSEIKELL